MTLIDKAETLLPCPFCGGSATLYNVEQAFTDYEVHCNDCGHRGPNFGSRGETRTPKEDAIAAWNRRYKPKAEELFDQQIAEYVKRGKP